MSNELEVVGKLGKLELVDGTPVAVGDFQPGKCGTTMVGNVTGPPGT